MIRDAWNALAFLSRLAPPPPSREDGETGLARAVPFYPLAGAALGLVAMLPALWVPSLAPWAYPLILAWLTRGLHWDGLADLADACGSNASGDRFWEIIKDSRIGAFGVMALVFGITGQMIAAGGCIREGNIAVLALAPAFGRAMVIVQGRFIRPHPASTLAALTQPGIHTLSSSMALAATLIVSLFILGVWPFLTAVLLTGVSLVLIIRIARAHGGANGDFHGTAVIASETAVLLAGTL